MTLSAANLSARNDRRQPPDPVPAVRERCPPLTAPSAEQLYSRLDLLCESRPHPQLAAHNERVRELAMQLGLVTGEAAWRRFAGFAIIGAYVYPYASFERLMAASAVLQWFFVVDDQIECLPSECPDLPAARRAAEHHLEVLSSGRLPACPTPIDRLSVHLRQTLDPLCPEGWMPRFLRNVESYLFRGALASVEYYALGRVPLLEDYLKLRFFDGAMLAVQDTIEIAADLHLPAAVLEEPRVWALRDSSGLHAGLLNDVFSSSKELDSDPFNLVRVYRVHEGLSETAALLKAVDRVNQEAARFRALERSLPSFGPETDRALARYVDGIRIWLRGHIDYSLASGRYQAGEPER
jgi:Terpene synthase family 2, C-terminal metal binding